MPYSRRTGPRDGTSGDQEHGEACQAEGGCTRQGEMWTSRGCSSGGAEGSFRTEMNCGRRPSAHGGSDSQGAPCASCRHADDQEKSLWRERRKGSGTYSKSSGCHTRSPLWAESGPSFLQNRFCQSSSSCHLQLCLFILFLSSFNKALQFNNPLF